MGRIYIKGRKIMKKDIVEILREIVEELKKCNKEMENVLGE